MLAGVYVMVFVLSVCLVIYNTRTRAKLGTLVYTVNGSEDIHNAKLQYIYGIKSKKAMDRTGCPTFGHKSFGHTTFGHTTFGHIILSHNIWSNNAKHDIWSQMSCDQMSGKPLIEPHRYGIYIALNILVIQ